ncbi:MAG: hypothetical protein MN733_19695 [Nitrososphaera sp.]|nr:hypothetical protein [Nitrososphaera sp.]
MSNEVTARSTNVNALGIASFVFGIISIFSFAIVCVPLAVILGLLGLRHEQKVWAILGLVCAVIGFITSPILMGLVALS